MELFIAFSIALVVNFIGMIPPGMVTLKLVSINYEKTFKSAILFAFGVAFVEFFQTMATLRFSSLFVNFFDGNIYIKWSAVVVLSILSVSFFLSKPKTKKAFDKSELNQINKKTSFFKGALLSLFNFLKYPFWITQGVYFMKNGLIHKGFVVLLVYSFGASLGSLLMYFLYIKIGNKILLKFHSLAKNINKILAIFFLLLAIIQLINIYKT